MKYTSLQCPILSYEWHRGTVPSCHVGDLLSSGWYIVGIMQLTWNFGTCLDVLGVHIVGILELELVWCSRICLASEKKSGSGELVWWFGSEGRAGLLMSGMLQWSRWSWNNAAYVVIFGYSTGEPIVSEVVFSSNSSWMLSWCECVIVNVIVRG